MNPYIGLRIENDIHAIKPPDGKFWFSLILLCL